MTGVIEAISTFFSPDMTDLRKLIGVFCILGSKNPTKAAIILGNTYYHRLKYYTDRPWSQTSL